jgi:mono/diheme cytochrome c family protein
VNKRTWIGVAAGLALLLALSACSSQGDLAEDLTPIPTLPPGEEPALVEAIQAGSEQMEQGQQGDQGEPGAGGGEAQLVARGEELFAGSCAGCHGAQDGAGPAFPGMGERAATRVEGQPAEEYLHESIVDPHAFVVEGFNPIMPSFADLPDDDIQALVAYILSESGGGEAQSGEGEESEGGEAQAEETPEGEAGQTGTEGEVSGEGSDAESGAAAPVEGDAAAGETLFAANCAGCHQAEDGTGPARTGMGERAATRVEGMDAAEYLHQSIVDPHAYVVEGFSDIMPDTYEESLSEEDINNLVAFLLTQ